MQEAPSRTCLFLLWIYASSLLWYKKISLTNITRAEEIKSTMSYRNIGALAPEPLKRLDR